MQRRSRENPHIRNFILEQVSSHPETIAAMASKEFGVSRAAIAGYLKRLENEGLIVAMGNTKARRYNLRTLVEEDFIFPLEHLEEDQVWRFKILPLMQHVPKNILDICHYGFTEMLNNAIDHSASTEAIVIYKQTATTIQMIVIDHGIGIFEKIQRDFNLPDPRSALLELSKGKLTSDKANHAGEGIFFTSRMFNRFLINSGELAYSKKREEGDEGWLFTVEERWRHERGTMVSMEISLKADWTMQQVFAQYQGKTAGFRKTHVPIKLGEYPGEQLVSRSQAKRILARFEHFSEILLDFSDVESIGQAFADEIFRVFQNAHPEINILAIRTSPQVRSMIAHVRDN